MSVNSFISDETISWVGQKILKTRLKWKHPTCYSVALDESTDICDTTQLAIFARGIDRSANITEGIAALKAL